MPPSECASKEAKCRHQNHQKDHKRNGESTPAERKNKAASVGYEHLDEQWCDEEKQYEAENKDEEAKRAKINEFRDRLLSHDHVRLPKQKAVERFVMRARRIARSSWALG